MKNLRIVFMGTPEFAQYALRQIVEAGGNVVAVVTVPDKPAGRGQQVHQSAVKQYAIEHNLPVLQPEKLRDEHFLNELKSFNADVFVVVAFRMLPEVVWNMPPKGTFNLHASLLPQYRGAAPINHAIINGETESGVTTFFLSHEIDTGNIILQQTVPITPDDNAGTLHDKLMIAGAKLILQTLDNIEQGNVETKPQPELNTLRPAPKIFKEDCRIDWTKDSRSIHNFIRGLSPYPCAFTELITAKGEHKTLKVFSASIVNTQKGDLSCGTIRTDNKSYLHVCTADGMLSLDEIQLMGKKRMGIADFLRGFKFEENCSVF